MEITTIIKYLVALTMLYAVFRIFDFYRITTTPIYVLIILILFIYSIIYLTTKPIEI